MKLFSFERTIKNQIRLSFFGIKIKLSLGKNRLDVWRRLFFTMIAKKIVLFDKSIDIKNYDIIIPLGKNCELATTYKNYFHAFMDSYLYNWAFYKNKKGYFGSVINPEKIFSNGIEFHQDSNMWECLTTGVVFHSNSQPEDLLDKNGNLITEKKEKEFEDIKSKIKYLVEKSIKAYKNPSKKLYMFTLDIDNADEDIEYIRELYSFFESMDKNFDMAIIIEQDKLCDKLKEAQKAMPGLYIRTLCYFREREPEKICHDFEYYKDWAKIFREFQYLVPRKKSNKKLKSEI